MTVRCSLHGKTMYPREKDGEIWYSHRLPNGVWCRGGPGDQPFGEADSPSPGERRRRYAEQFAELGFFIGASQDRLGDGREDLDSAPP